MNKVLIFHVRAGIGQRLPKAVEKKITSAMTELKGSVDWVGDKCVCFVFPTSYDASQFTRKAKSLGADVEMAEEGM